MTVIRCMISTFLALCAWTNAYAGKPLCADGVCIDMSPERVRKSTKLTWVEPELDPMSDRRITAENIGQGATQFSGGVDAAFVEHVAAFRTQLRGGQFFLAAKGIEALGNSFVPRPCYVATLVATARDASNRRVELSFEPITHNGRTEYQLVRFEKYLGNSLSADERAAIESNFKKAYGATADARLQLNLPPYRYFLTSPYRDKAKADAALSKANGCSTGSATNL